MDYVFQFGQMWVLREEFLEGTLATLKLSLLSMVLTLIFSVLGAMIRTSGPKWVRAIIMGYVEIIRNTPLLVQIFFIFFGLPAIGVRLSADVGALIAFTLNGTAYTIEIVRAGIESVGQGQSEAATALGLRRFQVFRLIVLPQALKVIMAPLGAQFILLMLNTSVASAIAANELTSVALDIQGRTFRAFESFMVVAVIYFILSLLFSGLFAAIERLAFGRIKTR